MRDRVREIVKQGDKQFSDRYPILTLWQSICEQIHVMRADYTRSRYPSEEFASHLMTGRPALLHRELKDSFAAMLRRDQWFKAKTDDESVNEDRNCKAWLERATKTQYNAMYDQRARFVRSTKSADGDFTSIGNAVITREICDFEHFLYRCWHPRDVAWQEDYKGSIGRVHFKWKPHAYELLQRFPKTVSEKVKKLQAEERDKKINCRRFLWPADDYDLPREATRDRKFVSVYVDIENETILEEVSLRTLPATIARWDLADGSQYSCQYGYSPAAIYALPDARMYQQMALTMLEVAQKAADPPLAAVGEAINGGVNLFAGGVSWKDADYDERTGKAIEHLLPDPKGIEYGAAREEKIEAALADAFFTSKIKFPEIGKQMTAFEASKLWEDFIRASLPLFEPVEVDYSGSLCQGTFEDMLENGAFGSIYDMPQQLRGRDVRFSFRTPITQAVEAALTQAYSQMQGVIVAGMQIDPTIRLQVDWQKATRTAIAGTGAPADWLRDEDEVKKMAAEEQQQQQAAQQAQQVATGADAASRVADATKGAGEASQALQQAGMAL